MSETDNPQIGLIKSDELFNTYGCVYPEYPFSDTVTVTISTHPVTSVAAGTVVNYQRLVSDASLSTDSGCVAFLGAVPDTRNENRILQIWPNPSDGMFNVALVPEGSGLINSIEIFNSLGIRIFMTSHPESQINLGSVSPGLYEVRAISGQQVFSRRLLVCR